MNPKVRMLAIAAGVVVGITGCLGVGLFFVAVPGLLIIGTLVQPRSDAGRPLMWAGALIVNFPGFLFGYTALSGIPQWPKTHDLGFVTMDSLCLLSFLLVCACDVALIIDAVKSKH